MINSLFNILKIKKSIYIALIVLFLISALIIFSGKILTCLGEFLVIDEGPVPSDAVVVLNTGMEYYPRLIEAANLYNQGLTEKIVINGNRKDDTLRELEQMGLVHCCPWYEERLRILKLYGVPRENVITISAEDVYDTITEARAVGEEIIETGISTILIVTSKSHTRRAGHIWKNVWTNELNVKMISAKEDPYDPGGWWKSGRQIKWVLSEYGAWLFLHWNRIWNFEEKM